MRKQTELPPLPKRYNRKESKVDDLVDDWFYFNYPYSYAVEVKVKGNKALPHQVLALKEVQDGAFSYKLPDMGRRNPFDIFGIKGGHGFVVTCEGLSCEAVRIDNKSKFTFKIQSKRDPRRAPNTNRS